MAPAIHTLRIPHWGTVQFDGHAHFDVAYYIFVYDDLSKVGHIVLYPER